jgi:hypothetical protein
LRGVTSGEHFFSSPLSPSADISAELPQITKSIVNHVQTSLARAPYNIDDFGAYQSAALSVRDNLIVSYDLLGYLKIAARITPSPHMHDACLLSPCPILSPSALGSIALCTMCECSVLRADVPQFR